MPKFLLTTYSGLDATAREIVTAPHIAKARAQLLARYPQARAAQIGTPQPYKEEFRLKYDDDQQQYQHLTLSFTLHRDDTAPYDAYAS